MASLFTILCHGRSGSTFLQKELEGRPETKCYGELYHPNYMKHLITPDNQMWRERQKYPQRYLMYMFSKHLQDKTAIGGKVLYGEINEEATTNLINWSDCHFIFLYRRNILEAAISGIFAGKLNTWHIGYGQTGPLPEPFAIDREELLRHINTITDFIKICKGNIRGYLFEVCYEELFSIEKINQICQFIHVPPIKGITANTGKQTTEESYQRITNRKEIEDEFGKMYGYLGNTDYNNIDFWKQYQ